MEQFFNDRFYLSFFVATHGFRESDFDYYSISYLSAHKSRPNVLLCVYKYAIEELFIQKGCDLCLIYGESLRKPALIHVRTTMAQISLRVRAGWSAPLLFAIACLFSTKKRLTNLNGEQNDTWNLLVSHRICHFRAVQPFDFYGCV